LVSDARVLDLFAGTGAVGIEALSRGARHATFVEQDRRSCAVLRRNLSALDLEPAARVMEGDVERALASLAREGERFEIVFADPPYGGPWLRRLLRNDALPTLLAPGAAFVVERDRREAPAEGEGSRMRCAASKTFGETRFDRYEPGAFRRGRGAARAPFGSRRDRGGTPAGSREMSAPRIAIYPASFDPVTNGHLDLVDRALKLFDELIVAVAINVEKKGLFSVEERLEMLRAVLEDRPRARVDCFDGLLVDYAQRQDARIVIRGLRALSDFEYEFEMALMNAHMHPELETVFLMTSKSWFYVSASRVRELVRFGADVSEFVPPIVYRRLREKLAPPRPRRA
jgi:pantetheine-phosphate adenylyltransferase